MNTEGCLDVDLTTLLLRRVIGRSCSPPFTEGAQEIRKLTSEDRARLQRLQKKRERRRLKRLHKKGAGHPKPAPPKLSPFLEWYAKSVPLSKRGREQHAQVEFPEVFSLIDNPDESLRVIDELVEALRGNAQRISVVQEDCKWIDHGAECAFSAIALDGSSHRKVKFDGVFPADPEQGDIVRAAGIPRSLGVVYSEPPGFFCYPLRRGSRERETPFASTQRELVTTEIVEYFESCLARYGHCLMPDGLEYLASLVSEVIGNAEEHSGRARWWVGAYMRQQSNQRGDCHVTIFSLGKTLKESLLTLPEKSQLRADIEALVNRHARNRFFLPRRWTEDDLWTLYALQEGVSRHNRHAELGDRGVGTADMIEFFQFLGQSSDGHQEPTMCVLSGHTHIRFGNKYRMKEMRKANGESHRIIAFNSDNDLSKPPDAQYIRHLDRAFPGTMISMRFFIDDKYLRSLEDSADAYS